MLKLKAVYRNGSFIPETACNIPEESKVELIVRSPRVIPAEITDPEEKKQHLQAVLASMEQNPIPANAPRFTREELHERR